jgi:two-component system probable response regulator PhcQ
MPPSILLLDDEPHVLAAIRRCLRGALEDGVSIETYGDAHEALARAGQREFDLVISDFRMPAMDGIQFLRFFREMQPNAMRMIVSASTEINGVMSAINDIGVFRYIVKPWTTDLLVEDVRTALALAEAQRKVRELADAACGVDPREAAERRRLEAMEPGLTDVNWGPNGEVVMPNLYPGEL